MRRLSSHEKALGFGEKKVRQMECAEVAPPDLRRVGTQQESPKPYSRLEEQLDRLTEMMGQVMKWDRRSPDGNRGRQLAVK